MNSRAEFPVFFSHISCIPSVVDGFWIK